MFNCREFPKPPVPDSSHGGDVMGTGAGRQFGPVRTFVMGGSDHRNHPALDRKLQDYLRRRNTHARHPGVLAAQRRERARIRSERQQRWGRPKPKAA